MARTAYFIQRTALVGIFAALAAIAVLVASQASVEQAAAQTTQTPTPEPTVSATPEPTTTPETTPTPVPTVTAEPTATAEPSATPTATTEPTATPTTPPGNVCTINGVALPNARATAGDCRALDALRVAISNPYWSVQDLQDPCNWRGVNCFATNSGNTGVQSISISRTSGGTIPPEIGEFTNIRNIALDNSGLTGTIPTEIGKLTTLTGLNIVNEKISGELPASIASLTNLRSLVLPGNDLSGPIPSEYSALENLRIFNIENNQLTGPIPDMFGSMQNLQSVQLANNELDGAIPSSLGNRSNLSSLNLASNKLSGALPDTFASATAAQQKYSSINLSNNRLTGEIPASFFASQLDSLELSRNAFSGQIPFPADGLNALTRLHVDNNKLEGPIPPGIFASARLRRVNVADNSLSGAIPDSLGQATNLRFFSVSNNNLEGAIPTNVGSLTRLDNFEIDGNNISGPIPASFPRNVRSLSLLPNGCFEATDATLTSYLGARGYFAPYGPCSTATKDWGIVTKTCASRTDTSGTLTFQTANPSSESLSLYAVLTGEDGARSEQSVTTEAGGSKTVNFTDVPAGSYTLNATRVSKPFYRITGSFSCADEDVTIGDTGGGGGIGDDPAAITSFVCLAATSRVDVEFRNPTGNPVDFTVNIGGIVTRKTTVPTNSKATVSAYDIGDGPIVVSPTANGTALEKTSLAINCTSSLSEPVEMDSSCMALNSRLSRGRFDFAVRNTTGVRTAFTVEVTNNSTVRSRTRVLSANQLWKIAVPNITDGTYDLSVVNGGQVVKASDDVEVSCANPPSNEAGVRILTACLAERPRADIFVKNSGDTTATYTVTYGNDEKSADVAAGGQGRIVMISAGDGIGPITVSKDGTTVYTQQVTENPCS